MKNEGRVKVLNLCTSSHDALYLVYICTKFHENILDGIKVIERTRFSKEKFQRGIIPEKMKVELQFLFSAHRLKVVYIGIKFHENILYGIKVIERTRFSWGKFQRGIIP